jgi:hypothetical protein
MTVEDRKLPSKVCPRCRKRKALRAFTRKRSPVTGEWLYRHCRQCDRRKQREIARRRKADPERWARYRAEQRERLRRARARNPEQYRRYSLAYRERLRKKGRWAEVVLIPQRFRKEERRRMQKKRTAEPYIEPPVGVRTPPYVDAEPLADWLSRHFNGFDSHEIAHALGVEGTYLRRVMDGTYRTVSLHIADRIFVAAGCPHLLAVLYPLDERNAA